MYKESNVKRKYQKSIFIFRRDLRLKDNTALINALYSSNSVYCFFILDSNILLSKSLYSSFSLPIDPVLLLKHKQRRIHLLRFLKESLLDLQKQFDELDTEKEDKEEEPKEKEIGKDNFNTSSKLTFLLGDIVSTIKKIIQADKNIEAVFVNRDYTPYSIKRDKSIKEIYKSFNIEFIECPDILINEPEEIMNSTNQPFKVFSHYYNKAIEKPLRKESSFAIKKYKNNIISFDNNISKKIKNFNSIERIDNLEKFFSQIIIEQFPAINSNTIYLSASTTQLLLSGTRKKYQELKSELKYKYNKDNKQKENENFNLLDKTASHLSPYLKLGICSIREVYSAIQKELGFNHRLLRQLYWRDFYVYRISLSFCFS